MYSTVHLLKSVSFNLLQIDMMRKRINRYNSCSKSRKTPFMEQKQQVKFSVNAFCKYNFPRKCFHFNQKTAEPEKKCRIHSNQPRETHKSTGFQLLRRRGGDMQYLTIKETYRDGVLGHQIDPGLLLHAIHSLSTGSFFQETRVYSGFKNTYKSMVENQKKTRI
jgi:hypothetical protein